MNRKKYENKMKKDTNVMQLSKYKYPKEQKAIKPRRSTRLQVSSASLEQNLIKQENGEVDDFLWYLVSKKCDKYHNQIMTSICPKVDKHFEWGKMNSDKDDTTSLFWIAVDGGRHVQATIKKSGIDSTVKNKNIGYGHFAARDLEKDQKFEIYLGYNRPKGVEVSEEIEYAITNDNPTKELMLMIAGGW